MLDKKIFLLIILYLINKNNFEGINDMSYTPKYLVENKNNYPNEPALSVKIDGE